jgi:hypothetical protein
MVYFMENHHPKKDDGWGYPCFRKSHILWPYLVNTPRGRGLVSRVSLAIVRQVLVRLLLGPQPLPPDFFEPQENLKSKRLGGFENSLPVDFERHGKRS